MSNRIPQRGQNQPINLPGAAVMVDGLKAEYHVEKHHAKMRRHPFDAGIDLYHTRTEPHIEPLSNSWAMFVLNTAVSFVSGPGTVGLIFARSSAAIRLGGAEVIPSVIDCHFTGELLIRVKCLSDDITSVKAAIERAAEEQIAVAQLVYLPMLLPCFAKWDPEMAKTITRGKNGFGSTDSTLLS